MSLVLCKCGREYLIRINLLNVRDSCGKCRGGIKTHRLYKTPEYRAWKGMRGRCNNTKDTRYASYGGRGIKVCDRWDSFKNFYTDMGPKPSPKHSLDRIDNDGNYEPSNCRWAINKIQVNNTRANRYVTYLGITKSLSDWCNGSGNSTYYRLRGKLRRGVCINDELHVLTGGTING